MEWKVNSVNMMNTASFNVLKKRLFTVCLIFQVAFLLLSVCPKHATVVQNDNNFLSVNVYQQSHILHLILVVRWVI